MALVSLPQQINAMQVAAVFGDGTHSPELVSMSASCKSFRAAPTPECGTKIPSII